MYRRNVGGIDRGVRVALGVILLPLGLGLWLWGGETAAGPVFALLGAVGLVSGVTGFCPPYALLGISTTRPTAGVPPPRAPR